EVGCVDYLTKPISPSIALARVKTHLALRQARQELEEWNSNLKGRVMGLSSLVAGKAQELATVHATVGEAREEWLALLVRLLDMLDVELPGHASRVAALAVEVARHLHCHPAQVETIRLAAQLHDIGKLGMDHHLTAQAPEALPEHQRKIYQTHAVRGQFLLSQFDWLKEAGVIIRHHHEEVNGSGMPDHLVGSEIPLGSRIIAIADYLDRTTNHAKDGTMFYTAFRKVKMLAGRCFDKELIGLFEEIAPRILERPRLSIDQKEFIPLRELSQGCVMYDDLYSGSRIVLAERGEEVSEKHMELIRRALEIDPPASREILIGKR
ncbi:MAG TPA: HD domain-containing phosphohydrolase, partial [Desulfuromonadaceae bacterium]